MYLFISLYVYIYIYIYIYIVPPLNEALAKNHTFTLKTRKSRARCANPTKIVVSRARRARFRTWPKPRV